MSSATEPALDGTAFKAALLSATEDFRFEETRFCRILAAGRCPRALLRRFAVAAHRGAQLFCTHLAGLVEQAPDPQARLILLENLMEEEGVSLSAASGLVTRPGRRHVALAARFLEACDGAPSLALDDKSHALSPGLRLLAEKRWLEAASFVLVGQELKFSQVSARLLALLGEAGFSARDLAFFAVHVGADRRHGEEALALIADRAVTADDQARCLAAARLGASHWFDAHGGSVAERRAA
jgi:pyrroloquinoline quinone (PQQ) biosynthesis protein C